MQIYLEMKSSVEQQYSTSLTSAKYPILVQTYYRRILEIKIHGFYRPVLTTKNEIGPRRFWFINH